MDRQNVGLVLGEQQDQEMIEQLRVVFDACDTEGHGLISLRELANISRSHVGRGQIDQILDILDPGEESHDKIDFDQFYQKFVEYMNSGDKLSENNMKVTEHNNYDTNMTNLNFSTSRMDQGQGVFNENLRRSFEKNIISPSNTSSPNISTSKVLQRNMRRKTSQARLSGRIPLVNTSSEDEAEDSFDRKIASSLALARPLDIQPQFLVRGSSVRNTVRKNSNQSSPSMSTSTRKFSTASRASPTSTTKMSPILAPSEGSSFSSPMSGCSSPSNKSGLDSPRIGRGAGTRLALDELERKVGQLVETRIDHTHEYDSPSSGVESLKADLEEQINSSLLLTRKHGEERLDVERKRHTEQVATIERERDLERRNFQLRFELFQEEQDKLMREMSDLKEKVRLVNIEKTHVEEQMVELKKQQINQSSSTSMKKEIEEEEQRRRDREEELMKTVQRLTDRVQDQDEQMAEAKEDNIVLRSQVKQLKELKSKECREGRFKLFRGGKENCAPCDEKSDDPQDIRVKLRMAEQELSDQKEVNAQLKHYVGEVLVNIMVKNPQMLEKN